MATSLTRERIWYSVGNAHSPTDPFGRSRLVIDPDGCARLEQHTRASTRVWSGTVDAAALDQLWAALEAADFPSFPKHLPPAGAAIRDLAIGSGPPNVRSAYIAYHLSAPGYDEAFAILDTLIRQLSCDTVKVGLSSAPIVHDVRVIA